MRTRLFPVCVLLYSAALFAQEFEVASVRIANPDAIQQSYMPTLDVPPGGVLQINNRQLGDIIRLAYDIGGDQLVGPDWLVFPAGEPRDITRFDIRATVPADAKKEDVRVMLQNLLAERFNLKVHRSMKEMTVYALEVGKEGHKLKASEEGDRRVPGCQRALGEAAAEKGTTAFATCQAMSMDQFAKQLSTLSPAYFRDGPIVNRTNLPGAYDFSLGWMLLAEIENGVDGPSMYEAVEKLGLTLDKRKEQAEVVVVDQVEQTPSEN